MAIQDTDLLLVNRNNTNYKVEAQNIMAIQDTDLLLVDRGGSNYKLEASELKDYASLPYGSLLKEYTAPWTSVGTKNFASSPNAICVIDSAGNVRRSTDGFTWSTVTTLSYSGGTIPQNSIAYGGNNIWLIWGALGGTFYRSTDDGLTWSAFTPTYTDWYTTGNVDTNNAAFHGLLGAPTTSSSNFAVFTSSEVGGSRLNYSTDGGINWTLSSVPGPVNTASAATINNSPVWAISVYTPPIGGVTQGSNNGYYTTNNGASWVSLGAGYAPLGTVGGGGNVICSSFANRIGDVIYPNALNYYDGTTYSFPGLSGILDNFSNINGVNGTGTAAAGGELIIHIGTYQNKIAAIGSQGTFLLTSTNKTGISTRQDNITSSGVGILGFKNRFFFFSSTNKVYYTSRFN